MKSSRILTGAAIMAMVWLILLVPACAPIPTTPTATLGATPISGGTAESNPSPPSTQESGDPAEGISSAAAARTPIPTPTPRAIERGINTVEDRLGQAEFAFLGLSASEWVELAGAVLIIVAGYFVARLLVNQILKWIVGRTKTKFDDEILGEVNNELRWFVVLFIAEFAVSGLSFLGDTVRTSIDDMFFLVGLIILTSTVMSLIRVGAYHYKANLDTKEEQDRFDPIIKSVQRFAYFIVLIVALSFGLAHFGVDTNTLLLILLVTSLIVSLAARDVIADALSGFIILVDQPFRQGDSVLIKELNTWGDVLDIGIRTTRIRTKDNRELIVPNSQVAKSQIVNYNFPDSKYRLQTDVGVAYGIDIDRIRKTATDAVRGVKYVLDDEQVDVFFIEFGDSARKIRVRWWIATFHDEWPALDEVNVALESAFEKANIEMPYETYALRVHMEDGGSKVSRPKLSASGEDLKADHE